MLDLPRGGGQAGPLLAWKDEGEGVTHRGGKPLIGALETEACDLAPTARFLQEIDDGANRALAAGGFPSGLYTDGTTGAK